jgi:hypothetical protein
MKNENKFTTLSPQWTNKLDYLIATETEKFHANRIEILIHDDETIT